MNISSLIDFIADYGYPRSIFLKNSGITIINDIDLDLILSTYSTELNNNNFNILIDDNKICLLKSKINNKSKIVNALPYSYIYNSIIKYIISNNYENNLKIDSILYILYYITVTHAKSDINDLILTEGVVIHLVNIIKLMIDKENTLYKNNVYINDMIEELRETLSFERLHIIK